MDLRKKSVFFIYTVLIGICNLYAECLLRGKKLIFNVIILALFFQSVRLSRCALYEAHLATAPQHNMICCHNTSFANTNWIVNTAI